ncbi:phospholipid-transporting ATPase ABCA3-like [Dermacentor variabilis]|uniref:phospholipid-transporting ATPase ABCA3-like n=1 Tax=Dermacentor variabilis TaxID=34621 RepID=UPI003F5B184E
METAGCWSQLGLVMWRQVWLTRVRRHYLVTLLELACMLFLLSSVWEESVAPYRARPNKDQFFDSADAIEFWGRPNESWSEGSLAFAPNMPFFVELATRVCKALGPKWTPMPFNDAAEATQYAEATTEADPSSPAAGHDGAVVHRRVAVWFDRPETDQLTYHVRFPEAAFDLREDYKRSLLVPGPANIDIQDETRLLLPLQYFVESTYIHMIAESLEKEINIKVELMRFPYPRLFYGSEDRTLSHVVLRFGIAFFVPFCVLVVKLVQEKRVGAKEMLRRAGLSDVAYWLGHFFESGFVVLCAVLLMYVPLFVIRNGSGTAFLEFANPVVFMTVLLLFGVLTILHAMLLSVFLWGPGVAFAAAVVYWFALGLCPYALLQNPFGLGYYLTSRPTKLVSALTPFMYLHWCLRVIERFEKYEVRLTWKTIFDSATTLDNVSVGELSLLSLSSALVMVGLIWYLDNVVPWGYGVPKPPYFIFSADYWSPYRKWNIRNTANAQDKMYFEQDPKNADPVVHLINLSATSKQNGGDVKNIILTIYNKQITVILGPQDCGHMTLLDIITGRQLPTGGEAYVCNFDASSYSGRTWEYFSVCPNESELFDDLTVEEHLLFFLFLRELPGNTGEAYVATLMRQLNIEQYKDTLVSQLSPRLQRVLCVAIAACAVEQTPLVIFPEPTRLMDPKARHEVWDVLARLSRRSSVLVTTSSIEEADVLADRLVIMREGRVVCTGSPTWLKTKFDSGFFLRFTKLSNFSPSSRPHL